MEFDLPLCDRDRSVDEDMEFDLTLCDDEEYMGIVYNY